MEQNGLRQLLHHPALDQVFKEWDGGGALSLHGLPVSAQAWLLASFRLRRGDRPLVVLAPDLRTQEELANDLEAWQCPALFLPELDGQDDTNGDPDLQAEVMDVLQALAERADSLLATTEAAWEQEFPLPAALRKQFYEFRRGQALSPEQFLELLNNAGYQREGLVSQRGQFAVRGGIIDVFSWSGQAPLRVEWFGDEIDSIREFDPVEQQSVNKLEAAKISLGALSLASGENGLLSAYFSESPMIVYLGANDGAKQVEAAWFEHSFLHQSSSDPVLLETRNKLLVKQFNDWLDNDWQVWISSNNEGEEQRLKEWCREQQLNLRDANGDLLVKFRQSPLLRGFSWPVEKLVLLADAEIFGRYQTLRSLRRTARIQAQQAKRTPLDFSDIKDGDYVVHVDHGIALYCGMDELPANDGKGRQAVLVLQFAEGAKLYVPLEQAYLVSRYVGVGKRHPALDHLGGNQWERAKRQAEKAVFDYAAELIKVQAERESLSGSAFPADSEWQKEFENAFLYKPTPDQLKAIEETKRDMESSRPMDRLICGDVGFGKTEVAIRAAFKAATAGKQVGFLVPTTVLAQQHYENLCERMADYPINIGLLSRFQSARQQRQVIEKLANGQLDIVVGTHRLISKDVSFKNLGLVIIDEEQRFGVRQKEAFKRNFRLIDVLTLSATPIPRTLYLSLMGARDMSSIETAPPNRLPVDTTICAYDERVIRTAIQRELKRGGQVYYLHNRVASIDTMARKIGFLAPDARIDIGHGQMETEMLEDVMHKFVNRQTDVLVSTTIIESGIDIPNANTIIIDRADRFGLADLYQLRGRVGRGQSRAYAILLLPRDMLGGDAGKRVQAIRQYTELGAGFKIAMRDLEIRGAGNLLGTAQSGHIVAVGFELYCRLLKKAIATYKGERQNDLPEVRIRLDFMKVGGGEEFADAFIPASYMTDARWRITAYRELAELQSLEQWEALRAKWKDRYGRWPEPVELLLLFNRVRLHAALSRITSLEVKDGKLMLSRNNDYIMVGGKFPRLAKTQIKARILEIEKWVTSLKN
ncbi:MAG: transcription-repair coupling factor [Verrucomicrobiales bacterium]|jgi:transcription-repair coupling factor (superfamily II helicase)|nr:transcription-repair coupling factor [Verrucomicrobiales bacterium]